MKKFILFLAICLCAAGASMAQLKAKEKCPEFYVDVLNGTVNGMKPNDGLNELKAKFFCFSGSEPEDGSTKCGGGVFFKDRDLYWYTKRDYIVIGPKFQGKMSINLFTAKRNSLFSTLGNPKVKDELWDAYETQYGCLVLYYDKAGAAGKTVKVIISNIGTESIQICE